jgi:hypothetical protein
LVIFYIRLFFRTIKIEKKKIMIFFLNSWNPDKFYDNFFIRLILIRLILTIIFSSFFEGITSFVELHPVLIGAKEAKKWRLYTKAVFMGKNMKPDIKRNQTNLFCKMNSFFCWHIWYKNPCNLLNKSIFDPDIRSHLIKTNKKLWPIYSEKGKKDISNKWNKEKQLAKETSLGLGSKNIYLNVNSKTADGMSRGRIFGQTGSELGASSFLTGNLFLNTLHLNLVHSWEWS